MTRMEGLSGQDRQNRQRLAAELEKQFCLRPGSVVRADGGPLVPMSLPHSGQAC